MNEPVPVKREGVSHLKRFFGFKDGQSLAQFAAETKELTDEDFVQLRDGIVDETLNY